MFKILTVIVATISSITALAQTELMPPDNIASTSGDIVSTSESIISTVENNEELAQIDKDILICLAKSDVSAEGNEKIFSAIIEIRNRHFYVVSEDETDPAFCINKSKIEREKPDDKTYAALQTIQNFFDSKKNVGLEIKPANYADQSANKKFIFAFKAAAAGAVGALAYQKLMAPILNASSNKGVKEDNITLGKGALIGIIVDLIQRLSDETNENRIMIRNTVAPTVAGMFLSKDPNQIGLGALIVLSQLKAVQDWGDQIAKKLPAKLDWKIPAIILGALKINMRHKPEEKFILSNHGPNVVFYGGLSYAITASTKNETLGFLSTTLIVALDETCDKISSFCKGRASPMDAFVSIAAGAIAAKLATILPPGVFLVPQKKGIGVGYIKAL